MPSVSLRWHAVSFTGDIHKPRHNQEAAVKLLKNETASIGQSRDLPRRSVLPTPRYMVTAMLGTFIYKWSKNWTLLKSGTEKVNGIKAKTEWAGYWKQQYYTYLFLISCALALVHWIATEFTGIIPNFTMIWEKRGQRQANKANCLQCFVYLVFVQPNKDDLQVQADCGATELFCSVGLFKNSLQFWHPASSATTTSTYFLISIWSL